MSLHEITVTEVELENVSVSRGYGSVLHLRASPSTQELAYIQTAVSRKLRHSGIVKQHTLTPVHCLGLGANSTVKNVEVVVPTVVNKELEYKEVSLLEYMGNDTNTTVRGTFNVTADVVIRPENSSTSFVPSYIVIVSIEPGKNLSPYTGGFLAKYPEFQMHGIDTHTLSCFMNEDI